MNTGGVSLGVLNFFDQQRQQKQQELQQQLLQQQIEGVTRSRQVAESSGRALGDMFSQDDGQLPQAPAPGQASVAAGGPAAAAQPPAAPGAPAPQMAPSPYKSYDDHVAANKQQQATPDALPAAPTPAAAPADAVTAKQPKRQDLGEFVRTLKRNNVPDWQIFEAAERYLPMGIATDKAQFNQLKLQTKIAQDQQTLALKEMALDIRQQHEDNQRATAERDDATRNRRIDEAVRLHDAQIENLHSQISSRVAAMEKMAKTEEQKKATQELQMIDKQLQILGQETGRLRNTMNNGTKEDQALARTQLPYFTNKFDDLNKRAQELLNKYIADGEAHVAEQRGPGDAGRPDAAKPSDKQGASAAQNRGGHKVGEIVTSPEGKKFKITGFKDDGTPLGEPQ
jgi:hypothetical protein